MKCRCGHGRSTHYRGQGKKRLPCWAKFRTGVLPGGRYPVGPIVTCKCRDWHPEEVKA